MITRAVAFVFARRICDDFFGEPVIRYSVNFFLFLSIVTVSIGRLWSNGSNGEVGLHLGFAIVFCAIAAALHFRTLSQDRRLRLDVAEKKEVATREAMDIYFAGLYLIPRFFLGSHSDIAWSLFIKSPTRRYREFVFERLAFPSWVLALVLYFAVWIAAIEGYQGGLASRHLFSMLVHQTLIESVFVVACSWLAAIFLFHALMRAFLMLKKESV